MNHVQRYQVVMKKLPKNILFYRDGVGENQIGLIKEKEFDPARMLLSDIYGTESPLLTAIVVTKRIDDRFFLKKNGFI